MKNYFIFGVEYEPRQLIEGVKLGNHSKLFLLTSAQSYTLRLEIRDYTSLRVEADTVEGAISLLHKEVKLLKTELDTL